MDASDEALARELRGMLGQTGYATAFGDEGATGDVAADDTGDAFFAALGAFRAARASGSAEERAQAEEELRRVVRGELTGE